MPQEFKFSYSYATEEDRKDERACMGMHNGVPCLIRSGCDRYNSDSSEYVHIDSFIPEKGCSEYRPTLPSMSGE